MAGNANSGRKRVPIPTGKEAEEELRKLRRQERRRERHAKKKAEEAGQEYVPGNKLATDTPAPIDFDGMPDPESLKKMFAEAFAALGGVAGLVAWGQRYPKEFYPMWAKLCIPKDVEGGESGSGLEAMLAQLDGKGAKEALN